MAAQPAAIGAGSCGLKAPGQLAMAAVCKTTIVALARKLLVALANMHVGVVIEGAIVKSA